MAGPGGASDFHSGRKVGKYEVLTLLSMGGMAELFLAFTAGPGGFRKFVALKQILPDIKKDESFVKMFLDEARITAAFSHSNIGQVFDLGEDDGELYLAMEFIAGQNLEQLVKAVRKQGFSIPVGFSALAVRDTCLALHYAHHFVDPSGRSAPVIHRDVSPKNVMVTYDGNVKVIDFGIAKARGGLGRTQVGQVKGTTAYMSPEQVRNRELDGRSDLFAAGIILHELLTGQRLFDAPGDAAMMMAVVEGDIAPPHVINPAVPEALSNVVMKALSRDREQRFATGKEMARAIEAAVGAELFDEDDASAFMQGIFADKVQKTRALLEKASRDDADLQSAAGALRDEPEAKTPPRARPPSRPRPAVVSRTPAPRTPAPRTPAVRPAPPARPSRPPPPPKPAERFASSVAQSYALYTDQESETSQQAEATVSTPGKPVVKTAVRPALPQLSPPKKKGGTGCLVPMLLLSALGGGGYYATTIPGPVGDRARALTSSALAWAKTEFASEPPPPAPAEIRPTLPADGPPPEAAGLVAQQEQAKREAEAAARQAEVDAALEAALARSDAELAAIAAKEKAAAEAAAAPPPPKPKAQTAPAVAKAAPRPAPPVGPAAPVVEGVEVLDTRSKRGAREDGVGWLTLYTVPPAYVYDGTMKLGTTPLIKVPLTSGTYKLRVVDADGQGRMLSAPVQAGEVTELKIRVSDLPRAPE